jgi:hypothetical protein
MTTLTVWILVFAGKGSLVSYGSIADNVSIAQVFRSQSQCATMANALNTGGVTGPGWACVSRRVD